MNRFLHTFILFVSAVIGVCAQTSIYNLDFENGIPETVILKDYDGLTPKSGLGFPENTAWSIWSDPNDSINNVVCSCSYYENGGQANDWLVIPDIALPEDSASCQMFWRSRSAWDTYKDGYVVVITTEKIEPDTEIGDLKWANLKFIMNSQNGTKWNSWNCDLSEYAGDTVNIGFINPTTDGWMLFIDDITIGSRESVTKGNVRITSDYYASNGKGQVTARLKAGILDTITSFTALLTTEEDTITQTYTGLNITPNEVYEFSLKNTLPGDAPENKAYRLAIMDNNGNCFAQDSSSFFYLMTLSRGRNIVAESYINSNDGYSLRAIEGYKRLDDQPWFIGVQLHGPNIDEDPMTPTAEESYREFLNNRHDIKDGRSVLIDRNTKGESYNDITELANTRRKEKPLVEVTIEGFSTDENIEIETTTLFALNSCDLNCSYMFILTEDSVWNKQWNLYTGGHFGSFNGYEDLDYAVNMPFRDVVRKTYSDDTFQYGNDITAGDTLPSHFTLPLASNILEPRMLDMTIIVTDNNSGEVLNAARCRLDYKGNKKPQPIKVISQTPAVEDIVETLSTITIEFNKNILVDWSKGNGASSIDIYDNNGNIAGTIATNNIIVEENKLIFTLNNTITDTGIYTIELPAECITGNDGAVLATLSFTFQVEAPLENKLEAPEFDLASGVYVGTQTVNAHSATADLDGVTNVTYYYTTDGNEPTVEDNKAIDGLITVENSCTVMAIVELTYRNKVYVSAASAVEFIITEEVTYHRAAAVENGSYFLVADGNVATPIEANGKSLPAKESNVDGNNVKEGAYYALTLEAVEPKGAWYTDFHIKDVNGNYIYTSTLYKDRVMSGVTPMDAWTIIITDDETNTASITSNGLVLVYVDGAFVVADANNVPENAIYPTLYGTYETGIENVNTNSGAVESIYDLNGRKIEEIDQPGIYIINGKKTKFKTLIY